LRRYFIQTPKGLQETQKTEQADFVMLNYADLKGIEHKLKNKTEEASRWAKKLTGEDQQYRLILVDYVHEYFRPTGHNMAVEEPTKVYVTVSLPVPAVPSAKNQAKTLVERVFSEYISKYRRYKLHWATKSGWSVNLELTENEFDSFQLPES